MNWVTRTVTSLLLLTAMPCTYANGLTGANENPAGHLQPLSVAEQRELFDLSMHMAALSEQIQALSWKNSNDPDARISPASAEAPPFPLTRPQIHRAQLVRAMAGRPAVTQAAVPPRASRLQGPCDPDALPLDMWFANYTIDVSGRELPDSAGWTPDERQRLSNFLCKMLPVIQDVYGDPFENYKITLVKDLYYSASNIFIPATLEIRGDGSRWNPRLLTHEVIHAFRGQRTLTSDAHWNYHPKLSGFEEGFAEGVAYQCMNEYARRYCDRDCSEADVPPKTFWISLAEWRYDFMNDPSMETEDFWSDWGGTLKYYDRYLVAAAAILRLNVVIPDFHRRFNTEYFSRIRNNTSYRPSRDGVIDIIEHLTDTIDEVPVRAWIDRQHIFASRYLPGKTDWLIEYSGGYAAIAWQPTFALLFVETFPNGSQWVYRIQDSGCSLFHRLNGARGTVNLIHNAGNPTEAWSGEVSMDLPDYYRDYIVRGCNETAGIFGHSELKFINAQDTCTSLLSVANPICIPQPEWGLYNLKTHWENPQYEKSPGPPDFAMPYDASQKTIATDHYTLAGTFPGNYQATTIFGGIVGAASGTITITHSEKSGSVTVPVRNGAFYATLPLCFSYPRPADCWVGPYSSEDDYPVTEPGTLTFTFQSEDGCQVYRDHRTIVFGNHQGKHQFLLNVADMEWQSLLPSCIGRVVRPRLELYH